MNAGSARRHPAGEYTQRQYEAMEAAMQQVADQQPVKDGEALRYGLAEWRRAWERYGVEHGRSQQAKT